MAKNTDRWTLTTETNSGYWTCPKDDCINIAEMATAVSDRNGEALCGPHGEEELARKH